MYEAFVRREEKRGQTLNGHSKLTTTRCSNSDKGAWLLPLARVCGHQRSDPRDAS